MTLKQAAPEDMMSAAEIYVLHCPFCKVAQHGHAQFGTYPDDDESPSTEELFSRYFGEQIPCDHCEKVFRVTKNTYWSRFVLEETGRPA